MKVLLLGEFSGFFSNLKKGLLSLGCECTLASNSDGWKKIGGTDVRIFGNLRGHSLFAKVYNLLVYPLFHLKRLYGFDVVYMVSASPFNSRINKFIFRKIKRHNKKVYVSVAGEAFSLYKSWRDKQLNYYIFDDNPKLISYYDYRLPKNKRKYENENYVYRMVDGIIPIMYEYAIGVRERHNCKKTIPLPFDYNSISYEPNLINGKIRIMHGILREDSKGTKYIKEAFEIIKKEFPDDVDIIIPPKMPLNEYLEFLKTVNILVDQCKEHCYGMNALYAMAEGRIVLGGASEASLKELGVKWCPVFHIEPDVDQIVKQIRFVISQRDSFEKLGLQSRKYVEEVHDCRQIAQMYLDLWKEE